MNTKQEVELLYATPLYLISNGIRYSHANWKPMEKFDNEDLELIKRVGFKLKHESVLEHSLISYHLKLSQKALLEATRHRIGVSWTVTSSRYALRKIDVELEPTEDKEVNDKFKEIEEIIADLLLFKSKSLDNVSKLLPQAFLYIAQVTFNLRSLIHFLKLRLSKDAHRDIRIVAYKMIEELPKNYQELVLLDKVIKENYERMKNE